MHASVCPEPVGTQAPELKPRKVTACEPLLWVLEAMLVMVSSEKLGPSGV